MTRRIYDISATLREGMAVWPGDVPFKREQSLFLDQGDPVNLSAIQVSLHTGTHADGPLHYAEEGDSIAAVPLERFIGPARVTTVESDDVIRAEHLENALAEYPERLLVHCNRGYSLDAFPEQFVHFSAEAAEAAGQAGVRLVGIDAPSVDPRDSKDLPAHNAFYRHGVIILENLLLDGIPDGDYELIAPPLKIEDGDGSPLRALLREL